MVVARPIRTRTLLFTQSKRLLRDCVCAHGLISHHQIKEETAVTFLAPCHQGSFITAVIYVPLVHPRCTYLITAVCTGLWPSNRAKERCQTSKTRSGSLSSRKLIYVPLVHPRCTYLITTVCTLHTETDRSLAGEITVGS